MPNGYTDPMAVKKKSKKAAARKPKSHVIEFDREDDGRWIAEIPSLPGAMAYGATKAQAKKAAVAIAYRILADRVEAGSNVLSVAFEVA